MREDAKWKKSAEHRGWRIFDGKRYTLLKSEPTKKRAKTLMRKLKTANVVASARCTKSLYYGDWNIWIRTRN